MRTLNMERRRRRAPEVPGTVKTLIRNYHVAHLEALAAKREADRLQKELLGAMNEEGLNDAEVAIRIEGQPLTVQAKRYIPEVQTIDMKRLKELVSEDKYDEMVTTTKTAINKFAGSAVASEVVHREPGTDPAKEKVSVKAKK